MLEKCMLNSCFCHLLASLLIVLVAGAYLNSCFNHLLVSWLCWAAVSIVHLPVFLCWLDHWHLCYLNSYFNHLLVSLICWLGLLLGLSQTAVSLPHWCVGFLSFIQLDIRKRPKNLPFNHLHQLWGLYRAIVFIFGSAAQCDFFLCDFMATEYKQLKQYFSVACWWVKISVSWLWNKIVSW